MDDEYLLEKILEEIMQFRFQGILGHAAYHTNFPNTLLPSLLKSFNFFNNPLVLW